MKRIVFLSILVILALVATPPAFAAKKRVRAGSAPVTGGVSYSSARLNHAGHSVVVTFQNLGSVAKVEYGLSYTANGIPQGAMGSISPSGSGNESRDLYFGTCSHGVCTPHYGISSASLTVAVTLKNGTTNTKRYVIKSI